MPVPVVMTGAPAVTAQATVEVAKPVESVATAAPVVSGTVATKATAAMSAVASGRASAVASTTPSAAPTTTASVVAKPPVFASLTGSHFVLGLRSPTCAPGKDCQAVLTLTATEGYHINKEYPYKFIVDAKEGVTYTKDAFAKASGDFQQVSETVGTTAIGFRAAHAFDLSGTFKMSVCSEANCQVEVQKMALHVPVD